MTNEKLSFSKHSLEETSILVCKGMIYRWLYILKFLNALKIVKKKCHAAASRLSFCLAYTVSLTLDNDFFFYS